jgi:hypothetical protein
MKNPENLEQKKCSESCSCSTVNDSKEEITLEEKVEQDPTRFGDWQVNGRAIDF